MSHELLAYCAAFSRLETFVQENNIEFFVSGVAQNCNEPRIGPSLGAFSVFIQRRVSFGSFG